MFKQKN